MASKKVILCPNPFRDERLAAAKRSKEILENVGLQTVVCLPFNREGYGEELGVPIRPLQQEIKSADLLIAFGGDGRSCIWPAPWRCTGCRCWGSTSAVSASCRSWSSTSSTGCAT